MANRELATDIIFSNKKDQKHLHQQKTFRTVFFFLHFFALFQVLVIFKNKTRFDYW